MSDNLPTNVQLETSESGTVSFAPEVIATIAGVATTEVEGVASMYAGSSGLADMFSRKSSQAKSLTKGVRVAFSDSAVTVEVAIIVDYGSPIPDVSQGVQENVKKAIETMSGLTVSAVNVHVQGLSFERENQKAIEEEKQQRIAARKVEEEMAKENEFWKDEKVEEAPDAAAETEQPEEAAAEAEAAEEETVDETLDDTPDECAECEDEVKDLGEEGTEADPE